MKKALAFLATIAMVSQANAWSVKHNTQARLGCLKLLSAQEAVSTIRRFNLSTQDAKPKEVVALGTGLAWVEDLNGGRPLQEAVGPGRGYPFKFKDGNGNSSQRADGIHISRKGNQKMGENVAQLVHELGHLVGNQGGYSLYRQHVGNKYCAVSSYAVSRPNEQFAEVFAAFVTNPDMLKDNPSATCQAAYKFFSRVLFANGEKASECLD